MQTIIFADRKSIDTEAFRQISCPALLPIAGRATVVHSIEDIADAGLRKVFIAISTDAQKIESLLGDGARWGVEIEYILTKPEELPSKIVSRCGRQLQTPYLAMRGDMFRSPALNDFIKKSNCTDASSQQAYIKNKPAGITLICDAGDTHAIDTLHWPDIRQCPQPQVQHVDIDCADVSYLEDMNDFSVTSLAIARGEFSNIHHFGLATQTGMTHGRNLSQHKSVTISGPVYFGNNVRIESGVNIEGPVVLCDDVMIDKGARLKNCLVLPDTYVGSDTNLENVTVNANNILRIDNGAQLRIDDNHILSSISTPIAPVFDRLIGLLLLVASLPLWLIAGAIASYFNPGQLLVSSRYKSNLLVSNDNNKLVADCFRLFQWNTNIPLLRNLPQILAVVQGHLRLIGMTPVAMGAAAEADDGKTISPQYGLISTALVELPVKASMLEKQINEGVYDQRRKTSSDILYAISALRCLFRPRCWIQKSTNPHPSN